MTLESAPYVSGSDTSQAAAESITDDLGRLEGAVLNLIKLAGEQGYTDDELEVATTLSHQCVSARRRALVLKGKVCDSGKRRLNRSGRSGAVWVIGQDNSAVLGSTPRSNGESAAHARRLALLEAATICAERVKAHSNLLDKAEAFACEMAIRARLEG